MDEQRCKILNKALQLWLGLIDLARAHSEGEVPVLVHLLIHLVERLDHAAGVVVRADHRVRLPAAGGAVREAARVVTVEDGADQLGASALVHLKEETWLDFGFVQIRRIRLQTRVQGRNFCKPKMEIFLKTCSDLSDCFFSLAYKIRPIRWFVLIRKLTPR